MELRQLQTFREAARSLSFTRAATTLNYAQSSVSAQIQALEEEFGVALFDRLGRRIILTDAGNRLLTYSEKILALSEEAKMAVTDDNTPSGTLTIGAPESLCTYRLPAVVECFRKRFPKVDIIFKPAWTGEDWQAFLSEGEADVAVILQAPCKSRALNVEVLRHEPILCSTNPTHRLLGQPVVSLEDFRAETVLLTEAGCRYRMAFERTLHRHAVTPAQVVELHSVEAIKQCAIIGMGVAVLPEVAIANELAQGRLSRLNVEPIEFNQYTQLVWHKDKWLSPALRAFMDVTRELLGNPVKQAEISVESVVV
ncbi:MAG: LysR family transcriptional regulator [Chloroflexota bacterium]